MNKSIKSGEVLKCNYTWLVTAFWVRVHSPGFRAIVSFR